MFDPHRLFRRTSQYKSRKGQVIQSKATNAMPYFTKEEVIQYIPYIINNGLLDDMIFKLILSQWRFFAVHDNTTRLEVNRHIFHENNFIVNDFTFHRNQRDEIPLPPDWTGGYDPNLFCQFSFLIAWQIPNQQNYFNLSCLNFCLNLTGDLITRNPKSLIFNTSDDQRSNWRWYDQSPISEFPIDTLKCDIIPSIKFNRQISDIHEQPVFSIFLFDDLNSRFEQYIQNSNFQYDQYSEISVGFKLEDDSVVAGPEVVSYSWLKMPKGLSIVKF